MTNKLKFPLILSVFMIVSIITFTILNTGTTLYNNMSDMTATMINEVDPYGTDYVYACKTVTQSTLFSIVTMPFIIMLAERLL